MPKPKPTILIADDDAHVRILLCEFLSEIGTVVDVPDGQSALAVVKSMPFDVDLVLLDLCMPEMGGVEAADRIIEICPNMPVILMTGYSLDVLQGSRFDLIRKPFSIDDLERRIRLLLGCHGRLCQ